MNRYFNVIQNHVEINNANIEINIIINYYNRFNYLRYL